MVVFEVPNFELAFLAHFPYHTLIGDRIHILIGVSILFNYILVSIITRPLQPL